MTGKVLFEKIPLPTNSSSVDYDFTNLKNQVPNGYFIKEDGYQIQVTDQAVILSIILEKKITVTVDPTIVTSGRVY